MKRMQAEKTGSRAIVIGGSIAGLLAARVLADSMDEVIILEKDELPDQPTPRRGTPQSVQLHSIHHKGAEIIQELFPDLPWTFNACGVLPCDLGGDMRWFFFGEWMPRHHAGVTIYWCDRLRFEWAIRQRVAAYDNVRIISGCKVTALRTDTAQQRITGVAVQMADGSTTTQALTADMVVDAAGRGSRVDQWLMQLGYPTVPESVVKIRFGDATRIYQLPDGYDPAWKALLISAKPGLSEKLGLIYRMPNNQIKVLLAGWFGDHPPADDEGFLAFARSLPQPDLYEQLRQATPVSPIHLHKLPSNQWRHYEQMVRWPEGLFVTGDAICSFNPSFGQGMTVAALQAVALGEQIRNATAHGQSLSQAGIARQFQQEAARIVQNPWMITTGEDLRFPQTEGPRPWSLLLMHRYLAGVFDAAHHDPRVAKRFLEVMTFLEEPPALFQPTIFFSVARLAMRKRMPQWTLSREEPQRSSATLGA